MTNNPWLHFVKEKVKKCSIDTIFFTKTSLIVWLSKRNNLSLQEMKNEILLLRNLVHVEKQEVEHKGKKEERFRCYFLYTEEKGRCYILKFNHEMKIITVFPLGKTTLQKYKRKFKY